MIGDLWVEKYRPKKFECLALTKQQQEKLNSYISNVNVQHSLFVGPSGTGKTTAARILLDNLIKSDMDYLFVNSSDDRGINFMRTAVIEFMKTPPLKSPMKLVVLDECDGITNDAWNALRNPIENPDINENQFTRFICTANNISAIPKAILSRLAVFEFSLPDISMVIKYIFDILMSEDIKYKEEDVLNLINSLYPDIRNIVNQLQVNSFSGTFIYEDIYDIRKDITSKTLNAIEFMLTDKNNEFEQSLLEIRELLHTVEIDYHDIVKTILETVNLPMPVFVIYARYLNTFSSVVSKKLHYIAMLYDGYMTYKRTKS